MTTFWIQFSQNHDIDFKWLCIYYAPKWQGPMTRATHCSCCCRKLFQPLLRLFAFVIYMHIDNRTASMRSLTILRPHNCIQFMLPAQRKTNTLALLYCGAEFCGGGGNATDGVCLRPENSICILCIGARACLRSWALVRARARVE